MCRGPHCLMWWGKDGLLFIGCAHCPYVKNKVQFDDEAVLLSLVQGSRDGHERLCQRAKSGRRLPPPPPPRRRRPMPTRRG